MTKEELIKKLIDMAKNGVSNPLDAYCDSCSCLTCPFHNDEIGECPDQMVGELIGRLIKAEESQKVETNFEHYVINAIDVTTEDDSHEVWRFNFKRGTQMQSFDRNSESVCDWLLAPYKPPKFKLTKFEYDLLDALLLSTISNLTMSDFNVTNLMVHRGYFKGISTDVPIKDILDNCEVIDE